MASKILKPATMAFAVMLSAVTPCMAQGNVGKDETSKIAEEAFIYALPMVMAYDHYADVNGNVYRNTGNGWEQHNSSGGWSHACGENLESEQHARNTGEQRAWASSGGHGWGGGGRRR